MKATLAFLAGLASAGGAAGAGPAAPLPPSWAMLEVRDALPASAAERVVPPSLDAPPAQSYGIPAAEIVGFELLLNEFDRHHFDGTDFDSNLAWIRHNLHHGWVVDRDP